MVMMISLLALYFNRYTVSERQALSLSCSLSIYSILPQSLGCFLNQACLVLCGMTAQVPVDIFPPTTQLMEVYIISLWKLF